MFTYCIHADVGDDVGEFLTVRCPSYLPPGLFLMKVMFGGEPLPANKVVSIIIEGQDGPGRRKVCEIWFPPGCPVQPIDSAGFDAYSEEDV